MSDYTNPITEKEDLFNRVVVQRGLRPADEMAISGYVMMVKLKKAIKRASDEDIAEINQRTFARMPIKSLQLNKEKLCSLLTDENTDHILRCLYLCEQEGIVEAMLCLLRKRKCEHDMKFLHRYFLYPMEIPHRSVNDM